jgi:hypothetical protein
LLDVAEIKTYRPVKLLCGIITAKEDYFRKSEERLVAAFGPVDGRSPRFEFDQTDYYEAQMGTGLKRSFISFERLIDPESLSEIKIRTNDLENEIRREFRAELRIINLDPGYITPAALIMATAKNFSHRIPLRSGIYGHLEFLYTKTGIRKLDWTYPDFAKEGYQSYFLALRKRFLAQIKEV